MIIGIKKLHDLVKREKLVENLCERELNNPEGSGFDLRLGEVYELETPEGFEEQIAFIGVTERNTPDIKLVGKHDYQKKEKYDCFVFEPGKYFLVKTMEKVNLPVSISGIIFPRTTLFRSGLGLFNGIVQPGYSGELTFGICNLGNQKMKISFGARIAHITFHEILGEGNQYRGQWQGGRVATEGTETQV